MPNSVFTSHASLDRAPEMKKFIELFRQRLRAKLGVNEVKEIEQLVFCDYTSLPFGGVWSAALADAVVEAETYLCLISPTYFKSLWCGREFEIARKRFDLRPKANGVVLEIEDHRGKERVVISIVSDEPKSTQK